MTGETAAFSALVVTPSAMPAPAIAYHWSWCPFAGDANQGYRCVVDKPTIDADLALFGLPPLPDFDLGIAPAAVRTELLEQMSPAHVATMVAKSPMKRLGEPAEVADLVQWLCSASCTFSTGAVFDLSGGRATY